MSEADRRGRKTATDAARRASRRSKLGPDPRCHQCGVADPALLMLEEHHVAGRANDATLTVTNCRNCHAENTERLRVGGVSMEPPADEFERGGDHRRRWSTTDRCWTQLGWMRGVVEGTDAGCRGRLPRMAARGEVTSVRSRPGEGAVTVEAAGDGAGSDLTFVLGVVRGWTEPTSQPGKSLSTTASENPAVAGLRRGPFEWPTPDILILDAETRVDASQRLSFGTAMHARMEDDGSLTRLGEYLFVGDDLADRDPDGFLLLRRYCRNYTARTARSCRDADPVLRFMTRADFVGQVLWNLLWKSQATLVTFNQPFDLSRLAVAAGAGRGFQYGAFSLQLWDNQVWRPKVQVKHLSPGKSAVSLGSPKVLTRTPLRMLVGVCPDAGANAVTFLHHRHGSPQ